jgi:hypothetical protein
MQPATLQPMEKSLRWELEQRIVLRGDDLIDYLNVFYQHAGHISMLDSPISQQK